jgi:15-cis-phytoene synthase
VTAPTRSLPAAPPALRLSPREVAEARATTRRVARTFSLACRLLPRSVRDDVYLLYGVFRGLDDLVDERRPEAAERVAAVRAWAAFRPGERTREVAVLEALAARHPIPRSAVAEFCAGMCQDLEHSSFTTEAELDVYCRRVAGTVGLVMTSVLGARDHARAREAALALGIAMQRTNILRDIDEDAAEGRRYVSAEAVALHGPPLPGSRRALLVDQIARADALYEQGLAGVAELRSGRRAIAAAGAMYREILRQLEREGYGERPGRAVVPTWRKLAVALRAAARP